MATLPDASTLGLPSPQASQGVASYQPHTRMEGMAGQYEQQAGNELQQTGDILKGYQDKQDGIVAMDAINRLKSASMDLAQDPDNGFQNVKGNAVVGQPFVKQYQDRFQQQQGSISAGLANDNQRRMFAQHAEVVGLGFQSKLYEHQAVQTHVFNTQTRKDTINLAQDTIADNPYDTVDADGRKSNPQYDTAMLQIGHAITDQGKDMGLQGKALSDYFATNMKAQTSKALASRTGQMMLDNPMAASDFFHEHEMEFDSATKRTLGLQVKTSSDNQITHIGTQQRLDQFVADKSGANAPVTPANLNAPDVGPMKQDRIDEIVNYVKKPSPYDDFINASAAKWNVSPQEIKLKIAAESSGNPTADNGIAKGLGQFTADKAKEYGIDPTDPKQAIDGIGRLIASTGVASGGDMSKVDRTYHGGNPNAQGPNTNQYVENMRAVRAQLNGGPQTKPLTIADYDAGENDYRKQLTDDAKQQRPYDAVFQDKYVTTGMEKFNKNKQIISDQNYSNYSSLLQQSIGDSGAKSIGDLSAQDQKTFTELPPQKQHSLMLLWKSNQTQDDKIRPSDETDKKSLAIMGEAINDPFKFKSRDIVADTSDLPRANRNQIYAVWQSIDKNMAKGSNYQHALSIMRPDMEIAKIKFPDKAEKGSTESFNDYNAFTKLLGDQVDNFQTNNKRNPNDDEIKAMARPLLGQATIKGGSWGGYGDKPVRAYQIGADNEAQASVPLTPEEKASWTTKLTNRYGYTPSDSQMQQAKLSTLLHPNDIAAQIQFDKTMRSNKPASSLSGQIPK